MPNTLIISGTDTDIGKTITTAAIAVLAKEQNKKVAVIKPVQTGLRAKEAGDLDFIKALVGDIKTVELRRYPDALSPEAAARRCGGDPIELREIVKEAGKLQRDCALVLIEGAGGLLVRFNSSGMTIADVAKSLDAPIVCTVKAGLGTLNTTALTAKVIANRGLTLQGLVIGKWPKQPDLAAKENLIDLPTVSNAPILGALPEDMGSLEKDNFLGMAKKGLSPDLGGDFELKQL